MMFRSPIARLSFGLVMLTVTTLLLSDALGFIPDGTGSELNARKAITESLAVQISADIGAGRVETVEKILHSLVARNDSVLSAALRGRNGRIVADAGGHYRHWTLLPGDKSTTAQVQVAIYDGGAPWGTVELAFVELGAGEGPFYRRHPFVALVAFIALGSFLSFILFLRRALRELDPSAVIPERVRGALDTLAEGLLILDDRERIVFANSAFALKTGLTSKYLMGKSASDLAWQREDASDDGELPWLRIIAGKDSLTGVKLNLKTALDENYTFVVNATSIAGSEETVRGALVTFDDITEVEAKNNELEQALEQLQHSKQEITRQNQELQMLATRDPLTGCLNRRSLFEGFATLFAEAREEGLDLTCIMLDIDHFKSINDRFGHSAGDAVIKSLADTLVEVAQPNDLVGRYGGEEFIVVLPGSNLSQAAATAERMRLTVAKGSHDALSAEHRVTASFGIACLSGGARDAYELVDRADKALYLAKQTGRNKVVSSGAATVDAAEHVQCVQTPSAAPEAQPMQPVEREVALPAVGATAPDAEEKESAADLKQRILALEQALRESESKRHSVPNAFDPMDLPNRTLLYDRLAQATERARRYGTTVAVLSLHMDALNGVKYILGHAVAEKFIKSAAGRLRQTLRRTDTVAVVEHDRSPFTISRLGSDEFAILLTDLERAESVTRAVDRILEALKSPIFVEATELYMNASIGISVFPGDGEDADTLVAHAGAAMREAKDSIGPNACRFFSADIDKRLKTRISLGADLHRALERDELFLCYQPKVKLATGEVSGMEALVRWQHPRRGIVGPDQFIPLAEQVGLIDALGEWVLGAAVRQAKVWSQVGHGRVPIAVNLSPSQFRRTDLASRIAAKVRDLGIPPNLIELEITETVVMQNVDAAVAIVEELSAAGLATTLDDFGTGYSSLSYLRLFPFGKLKIDRTFVSSFTENARDRAIVTAIIAMAHGLDIEVVAEGVETEEQLRALWELGCDEIQGYLIAKPLRREEATELLTRRKSIQRKVKRAAAGALSGPDSVEQTATLLDVAGILSDPPAPVVCAVAPR